MKTAFIQKTDRGFTMLEIALSLAVIGFAVVAIIGILPYGLNVQKQNRESTIVSQDATVFLSAMRNGDRSFDDLTNYLVNLVIVQTGCKENGTIYANTTVSNVYTFTGSSTTPVFPLTNGFRILGLLNTPRLVPATVQNKPGLLSNYVYATFRAMSGPAEDKPPQNNTSIQDMAFSYQIFPTITGYSFNNVDPGWTNYLDYIPNTANYNSDTNAWVVRSNNWRNARNIDANLHDLRLIVRWPVQSDGMTRLNSGFSQSYRSLVSGQLMVTNDYWVNGPSLFFFQPQNYTNATMINNVSVK